MKKISIFIVSIVFSSLLIVSSAFATKDVGNGGDAVVCRDSAGKIMNVEQLDSYEARTIYGLKLQLPTVATSDPTVLVNYWLNNLSQYSPVRANFSQPMVRNFFYEAEIIYYGGLPDIPDHGDVSLPSGCKLEQVAIQVDPAKYSTGPRYKVEKEIFENMPTVQKAILILHEVVYRELLMGRFKYFKFGTNSTMARVLTGLISSESYAEIATTAVSDMMIHSGLLIHEKDGIAIKLARSGYPYEYTWPAEMKFYPDSNRLKYAPVDESIASLVKGQWVKLASNISFHENGKLLSVMLNEPMKTQYMDREEKVIGQFSEGSNGEIRSATFVNPVLISIQGNPTSVYAFNLSDSLGLPLPFGKTTSFVLAKPMVIKNAHYVLALSYHIGGGPWWEIDRHTQTVYDDFRDHKKLVPYFISGTGKVYCNSLKKWLTVNDNQSIRLLRSGEVEKIFEFNKEEILCLK